MNKLIVFGIVILQTLSLFGKDISQLENTHIRSIIQPNSLEDIKLKVPSAYSELQIQN